MAGSLEVSPEAIAQTLSTERKSNALRFSQFAIELRFFTPPKQPVCRRPTLSEKQAKAQEASYTTRPSNGASYFDGPYLAPVVCARESPGVMRPPPLPAKRRKTHGTPAGEGPANL
jgi:hypothetical protein